jgi:hypothetical protein
MTISVELAVPATAIAGVPQDISGLDPSLLTWIFRKDATSCDIVIEVAEQNIDARFVAVDGLKFKGSDTRTLPLAAKWARARRTRGSGGVQTLVVCAAAATAAGVSVAVDEFTNPVAADTAGLEAATASQASVRSVTSFLAAGVAALAAYPRNITLTTAGGTESDAPATAAITGTDVNGVAQSETVNVGQTAETVSSAKLYSTVERVEYPAGDGTDATVAIGFGAKLGLSRRPMVRGGGVGIINEIAVGARVTNGTFESPTTAPPHGSYTPNSAADGTRDYALYYELA